MVLPHLVYNTNSVDPPALSRLRFADDTCLYAVSSHQPAPVEDAVARTPAAGDPVAGGGSGAMGSSSSTVAAAVPEFKFELYVARLWTHTPRVSLAWSQTLGCLHQWQHHVSRVR